MDRSVNHFGHFDPAITPLKTVCSFSAKGYHIVYLKNTDSKMEPMGALDIRTRLIFHLNCC